MALELNFGRAGWRTAGVRGHMAGIELPCRFEKDEGHAVGRISRPPNRQGSHELCRGRSRRTESSVPPHDRTDRMVDLRLHMRSVSFDDRGRRRMGGTARLAKGGKRGHGADKQQNQHPAMEIIAHGFMVSAGSGA